jgi:hypothetical protein
MKSYSMSEYLMDWQASYRSYYTSVLITSSKMFFDWILNVITSVFVHKMWATFFVTHIVGNDLWAKTFIPTMWAKIFLAHTEIWMWEKRLPTNLSFAVFAYQRLGFSSIRWRSTNQAGEQVPPKARFRCHRSGLRTKATTKTKPFNFSALASVAVAVRAQCCHCRNDCGN